MRRADIVLLAFILTACQPAPTAATNPTEVLPPTATPAPTATQTAVPTATISPSELRRRASPICENAFSTLVETGPLIAPFAVLKTLTTQTLRVSSHITCLTWKFDASEVQNHFLHF
jgi:hypothetical protein